jgi:hypothetical protein
LQKLHNFATPLLDDSLIDMITLLSKFALLSGSFLVGVDAVEEADDDGENIDGEDDPELIELLSVLKLLWLRGDFLYARLSSLNACCLVCCANKPSPTLSCMINGVDLTIALGAAEFPIGLLRFVDAAPPLLGDMR